MTDHDCPEVEYRLVPGSECYRVSNFGTVQSLKRGGEWRDLKSSRHRSGYSCVALAIDGRPRSHRVHSLVLAAFVGPRPEGKVARHLNDDPADNRLENLKWGTPSENSLDSVANRRTGTPYRRPQVRMPRPYFRTQRDSWCVQIGKRQITLAKGKANQAEALAAYHRLMATEGKPPDRKRWTAAELLDLFLDHAERTVKASTYGWYRDHLQSFANHAGKVPAVEVRPLHATGWVDAHPKWGPSTRRGALTAIKRAWAWATEQGYLEADALAKLRRPKMGRRDVMTAEEADRALAAIRPGAFKDFVEGLRLTGCRPGELASVRDQDVGADGMLTVRGKSGERRVPITGALAVLLARRLAASRPGAMVWANSWGRPWQRRTWVKAFWRLQARTGIGRATAYSFRHLYGSLAIERGVDSLLVAELMGHRDLKMLHEFYAKHKDETLRKAAERATGGD